MFPISVTYVEEKELPVTWLNTIQQIKMSLIVKDVATLSKQEQVLLNIKSVGLANRAM